MELRGQDAPASASSRGRHLHPTNSAASHRLNPQRPPIGTRKVRYSINRDDLASSPTPNLRASSSLCVHAGIQSFTNDTDNMSDSLKDAPFQAVQVEALVSL